MMVEAVELFSAVEDALNDREIAAYEDFTEAVREVLVIARKVEAMDREIAAKDARIFALELTIRFVALWAWRDDPPNANSKLTDAERLSVIKHHPTVKSFYETDARALLSKENADAK